MNKIIEKNYKLDLEKIQVLDNKNHNPHYNIIYYQINNDENITFCNNITNDVKLVEYYKGINYNVNSNLRSYSKVYELNEVPKKYKDLVNSLIKLYNMYYKTNYLNLP